MAEDTMEICAASYGDEDFDFDFDLTAASEDEDTVLEDVNSAGHSVKSHPEIFQAGNELMNDDNESLKEMDDIETFTDFERTKNQDDSMSLNTGNSSNSDGIQTNSEFFDGHIYDECTPYIQHDFTAIKSVRNDPLEENALENKEDFLEDTNHEFKGESPVSQYDNVDSQNCVPLQPPNVPVLASSGPLSPEGQRPIHDDKRANSTSPSPPNDTLKIPFVSEITSDDYDLSYVVVSYQANEYALFSSSEFDDPNSFFIKDRTIAQEPLSDFFKAIRNVVDEDLDDESELYISFPNFGLQVEETSSLVRDITLSKIICIRNQLLLNDGVEMPQPMYIDLGIRKNFAKELRRITMCANNGKGLSEIASWHEIRDETKSFNVSGDGLASPSDKQPVCEQSTAEEEPVENIVNREAEVTCEVNLKNELQKEQLFETTPDPEKEECQELRNKTGLLSPNAINSGKITHTLGSTESFQKDEPSLTDVKPKDFEPASNSPYNADSDIIDYSEDEDENEEDEISEACTLITKNEDKSDSNWNSNKKTSKHAISHDKEKNCSIENIASSKITECPQYAQAYQSKCFKQEIGITANELSSNMEDDFQALDERLSTGQASSCKDFHESTIDLKKYVDIPNEINEVKVLDECTSESYLECERFDELEAQQSDSKVPSNEKNDDYETDIIEQKTRDTSSEDEVNNFHESVRCDTEETHIMFSKGVGETFKDLNSDRCSSGSSIDSDHVHASIPQFAKIGDETEDEIDYEDEEDEERNFKTDALTSNLHTCQPIVRNFSSINGKRPRADCRLEATAEKIDVKRSRS